MANSGFSQSIPKQPNFTVRMSVFCSISTHTKANNETSRIDGKTIANLKEKIIKGSIIKEI